MKNEIAAGRRLTVTAAAAITGGQFVVKGSAFGVASSTVAIGEQTELQLGGVFNLPKETGTAWTQGDVIYWDATNSRMTKTSSGNTKVGVAYDDAASAATTGNVRLNGSF